MPFYIRVFTILFFTVSLFISFNLGMDYVNFGYGLHPYVAFPVSIISVVFIIWMFGYNKVLRFIHGD